MRVKIVTVFLLCLLVTLLGCASPPPVSSGPGSPGVGSPTIPLSTPLLPPTHSTHTPTQAVFFYTPLPPSHTPPPPATRIPTLSLSQREIEGELFSPTQAPATPAVALAGNFPSPTPETAKEGFTLPIQVSAGAAIRPWRIMPLGDSLTSGNYPGRVHSYRGYLETLLHTAGYSFDFVGSQSRIAHAGTDPDHEGHSGFSIGPDDARFCDECSTANLYDHLEEYLVSEPDIILLLIGINDLLPLDVRPVDPANAPPKLAALVQRLQELRPSAYIFVASLAPINYMDSANLPYYAEVNQMAEQLGADPSDQVYFVDLNRSLAAVLDPQADFADGIHLAEGGARKMALVWFNALVSGGLLSHSPP